MARKQAARRAVRAGRPGLRAPAPRSSAGRQGPGGAPGRAARGDPRGGARRIRRLGFAATRLDDVARRAGVAKGTIYLYFRDKESLFQELVRAMLSPSSAPSRRRRSPTCRSRVIAETIVEMFVREIFGTRRKDVIRLIITEGPRFPKLAEFYYREVIARVTRGAARAC